MIRGAWSSRYRDRLLSGCGIHSHSRLAFGPGRGRLGIRHDYFGRNFAYIMKYYKKRTGDNKNACQDYQKSCLAHA